MKISIREAFGNHLLNLGKKKKKIIVLSCDLKDATKTKKFFNKFPNRSFEIGISEANAIGIAAGLSLCGFTPIISSFAAFITGKHIEIRTSISYNKAPVIIIGTHGGIIGPDGATQSATQDLLLMRSMPNFNVFQPCSQIETRKILDFSVESKKPTYIRISRNEVNEIYNENYKFVPGDIKQIIKGNKLAVISSGPIIHNCYKAIKENYPKGVALYNVPSYKPFNQTKFLNKLKPYKNILVVEDHSVFGGLRGLISEIITTKKIRIKLDFIGINDCFIESGSVSDLEKNYKLSVKEILKKIKKILNWYPIAKQNFIFHFRAIQELLDLYYIT